MPRPSGFRDIVRLTGGAYASFDLSAPERLAALLGAPPAYAAGGKTALQRIAQNAITPARSPLPQMSGVADFRRKKDADFEGGIYIATFVEMGLKTQCLIFFWGSWRFWIRRRRDESFCARQSGEPCAAPETGGRSVGARSLPWPVAARAPWLGFCARSLGFWLLGISGRPCPGFVRSERGTAKQSSRVRSAMIEMELDHETGKMRGSFSPDPRRKMARRSDAATMRIRLRLVPDRRSRRRASTWKLISTADFPVGVRQVKVTATRADAMVLGQTHRRMSEDQAYQVLGTSKGCAARGDHPIASRVDAKTPPGPRGIDGPGGSCQ